MSENVLPGFRWERNAARYRVLTPGYGQRPGTFVARDRVLGILESKVEEGQQRLQGITKEFINGNLTAKEWQVAFARQLKILYGQQAALGAGGLDRLTPQDYGRMGGYLRAEYARLPKFAQDILKVRDLEGVDKMFLARARMYAGKARAVLFRAEENAQIEAGKSEERRILGATDHHCDVCVDYAAEGWQPIGHFLPPGGHPQCWGNCLCTMEYR